MVKSDFLKSMKNTNFFKNYSKPLAVLAILIILSIVLFYSYKEYSLENFKPKPDVKLEVGLWVNNFGSVDNIFVRSQWLEFVNKYEGFPNIEFLKENASNFIKYLDVDKNANYSSFKDVDYVRPPFNTFASIIISYKDGTKLIPTNFLFGKDLTFENLTMQLNRVFTDHYTTLYDNGPSDAGNAMPAMPTMPTTPTMPTEMPKMPTEMPKMPWSS